MGNGLIEHLRYTRVVGCRGCLMDGVDAWHEKKVLLLLLLNHSVDLAA